MADMVKKTEGRTIEWNLLPAMRELFQCEPLRDLEPTPSTAPGLNRTASGPTWRPKRSRMIRVAPGVTPAAIDSLATCRPPISVDVLPGRASRT